MAKAGRGDDQYMIRFPEGLRDTIKEAAELHGRSMNTEIIERLEKYTELARLPMDVSYLRMENERLTAELTEAKSDTEKQRVLVAQLQHLIDVEHEEAERDQETLNEIERQFNELKEQAEYLEKLKAEILELSKERQELDKDRDKLIEDQSKTIEALRASQGTHERLLQNLVELMQSATSGNGVALQALVDGLKQGARGIDTEDQER
jgi:DNA repair exonuclease SbcCD ATPase subunit